ncbi:MAG TPA: hypothetical protein VEK75_09410, partial [Xanthobacteraceae bacterium]|nr:hypothetical protein [Xanthobacteraceae bacterium]
AIVVVARVNDAPLIDPQPGEHRQFDGIHRQGENERQNLGLGLAKREPVHRPANSPIAPATSAWP